jgi:hypothetical protein
MARIIKPSATGIRSPQKLGRASMPHVSRTAQSSLGLVGVAFAAAFLNLAGVAQAGDLYQPPYGGYEPRGPYGPPPVVYGEPRYVPPPVVYGEPRYVPPVIDRRVVVEDGCRVVHRRRIDPYGREIVRRVRVCGEGGVEPHPHWVARAPRYGYDPYGYDAPRPPRAVAPDADDDLD